MTAQTDTRVAKTLEALKKNRFGVQHFSQASAGVAKLLEEIPVEDEGIIMAVESDEDCALGSLGREKLAVYPQVQLTLERNEGFFGPQAAQFLSLIDHTGSMQTACRQMHMSYTKGWKILKEAERQLGYPLLITQSGGAEGGF